MSLATGSPLDRTGGSQGENANISIRFFLTDAGYCGIDRLLQGWISVFDAIARQNAATPEVIACDPASR